LSKNLAGLDKTSEFVWYAGEKDNSELFQGNETLGAVPGDRKKDFFP
jgi:hypothetical protein